MLPVNDLGSWTVGQLSPNWEMPLIRTDPLGNPSSRVMDLTNVSTSQLSLILYNAAKIQTGTGAGTFTINNVKPGVVTYAQATADMANAGTLYLRVKVNYNGNSPDFSDYIRIVIAN
jgi:hypothetical protein